MASKAATPAPLKIFSSGAEILAIDDRKTEQVATPEWGEGWGVIVQSLTGTDRDAYEAEMLGSGSGSDDDLNLANLRAKLAARTIVDEEGNRLFTEDRVVALGQKNASALERVCEVARRLSRLRKDDVAAAKAELGKGPSSSPGSI